VRAFALRLTVNVVVHRSKAISADLSRVASCREIHFFSSVTRINFAHSPRARTAARQRYVLRWCIKTMAREVCGKDATLFMISTK